MRRWCPPLLGLEPHCPPARYLARRRELGTVEAGHRLLRGSGITAYLVDTGLPDDLTDPDELARAGQAEAHEIVRLEQLAEQVADTSGTVESFLANLAESVHGAAAHAVAFTSVAGLRHGLALAPEPPEAGRCAARPDAGWPRASLGTGSPTRCCCAICCGSPSPRDCRSSCTCGLGAPGARVDRTDPVLLTDFVRATAGLGTDLVLLHGYPYHRHAAHLAGVFPHVYADCGAALVRTGARAATVLAEVLELAPFGKILFSSGARGLPELHVVGAHLFREALARVLGGWVSEGAWSLDDAQRVATMIASGNAARVYGLS